MDAEGAFFRTEWRFQGPSVQGEGERWRIKTRYVILHKLNILGFKFWRGKR